MMTNLRSCRTLLLAGAGVLAGATLARAQMLDVKLGLWEATTSMSTSGLPPIDTGTPNLTPDQRARLEALLKSRQGAQPPRISRECITKEKLEKSLFQSSAETDSKCTRTVVSNSRTLQEMKVECTGARKSTGDVRVEAPSPDNVKITGTMLMGDAAHAMTVSWTSTAKWLSADCGSVK